MTFCNCALPAMTGSDECCKKCINNNCAESQNAIFDICELVELLDDTKIIDIDNIVDETN